MKKLTLIFTLALGQTAYSEILPSNPSDTEVEVQVPLRVEDSYTAASSSNGVTLVYEDTYSSEYEAEDNEYTEGASSFILDANQPLVDWYWISDRDQGGETLMKLAHSGSLTLYGNTINRDENSKYLGTPSTISFDALAGRILINGKTVADDSGYFESLKFIFGSGSTTSGAVFFGGTANGERSFAVGSAAQSSGDYAFSFGYGYGFSWSSSGGESEDQYLAHTLASGESSYSMGFLTEASGNNSFAFGRGAASINYDTNYVDHTIHEASGDYSVVIGFNNQAISDHGVAIGSNLLAEAKHQFVVGQFNLSEGKGGASIDSSNPQPTDPIFEIGNGDGTDNSDGVEAYQNAMTVYRDGTVDIARIKMRGDLSMGPFTSN